MFDNIKRFSYSVKNFIGNLKSKKIVWIPATVLFWLMPVFYLFQIESFHKYPVFFLKDFLPERIPIVIFGLIFFIYYLSSDFFW